MLNTRKENRRLALWQLLQQLGLKGLILEGKLAKAGWAHPILQNLWLQVAPQLRLCLASHHPAPPSRHCHCCWLYFQPLTMSPRHRCWLVQLLNIPTPHHNHHHCHLQPPTTATTAGFFGCSLFPLTLAATTSFFGAGGPKTVPCRGIQKIVGWPWLKGVKQLIEEFENIRPRGKKEIFFWCHWKFWDNT